MLYLEFKGAKIQQAPILLAQGGPGQMDLHHDDDDEAILTVGSYFL